MNVSTSCQTLPILTASRRLQSTVPDSVPAGATWAAGRRRLIAGTPPSTCSASANAGAEVVLRSPSSSEISAAIAHLYEILGSSATPGTGELLGSTSGTGGGDGSTSLGACPPPDPSGKGWINARTGFEVFSATPAPYGVTESVDSCNTTWAQEVWKAASAIAMGTGAQQAQLICNNSTNVSAVFPSPPSPSPTSSSSSFPWWAVYISVGTSPLYCCAAVWALVALRRRRRALKQGMERDASGAEIGDIPPIPSDNGSEERRWNNNPLAGDQVSGSR